MSTMYDIVRRAYRKLGISGSGETLEAEEYAEGIEALNSMLHEWKLRAVDISHTDKGGDEAFPIGPEYEEGTVFLLAARISPDYEVPARFDADDFFRAIQAAYMTIDKVTFDAAPRELSTRRWWNYD